MRAHNSEILRHSRRHANLTAVLVATAMLGPGLALADAESLDGFAMALGPSGGVHILERDSDGWLGGAVSLAWIREENALSSIGGTFSGGWLTEASGGWMFAELELATNRLFPLPVGIGIGGWLDVDEVRSPRGGPRVSLWAFAGIVPYAAVGIDTHGKWLFDAGLRIPFPILRL